MEIQIKTNDIKKKERNIKNKLVFEKESIYDTNDPFTSLFRCILYSKKITEKQFKTKVKDYYISLGANSKSIIQQPNNMLRHIKLYDKITFKRFLVIIERILGLKIKRIGMELIDFSKEKENGKEPQKEKYSVEIVK